MPASTLRKFASVTAWFALLVIVWGAYVRMSGSGDGCGVHWPLCHGEIIPDAKEGKTWIEYTHRALSGIFGLMVFYLFIQTRRSFSAYSYQRAAALIALLSTIAEALIGAKLVLWELVGNDQSMRRVVVAGAHLCNTFILLGSLAALSDSKLSEIKKSGKIFLVLIGVILFLSTSILGSWGSLSTTLFPSSSLASGLGADLSPQSHFIVRYRMYHPIVAIALTVYLLLLGAIRPKLSTFIKAFPFLALSTFAIGALTLASLSPLWLRLTHLLFVDLLWISFAHVAISICSMQPVQQNAQL